MKRINSGQYTDGQWTFTRTENGWDAVHPSRDGFYNCSSLHEAKDFVAGRHLKPCPTNQMVLVLDTPTVDDKQIVWTHEGGAKVIGAECQVNAVLAAMGYAQVAIRRNIQGGALYLEAKDTPLCCSPASETYWSM